MGNTIYTRERVKAIVEETRLNADPSSNRQLYDLMLEAKSVLRTSFSESIDPVAIDDIKRNLSWHTASYVARHYRQELECYRLMQEADGLLQARAVFDLNEIAYLVRDLGSYSAHHPEAKAYRQELDKLWIQVQKGKLHAQGIQPLKVSAIKIIAGDLKPYKERSTEIFGIHASLDREVEDLERLVS